MLTYSDVEVSSVRWFECMVSVGLWINDGRLQPNADEISLIVKQLNNQIRQRGSPEESLLEFSCINLEENLL